METLVVANHRNHHQHCGRNRVHDPTRFGSFGSAPRRNVTGISCRTFHSGAGLVPTPSKYFPTSLTPSPQIPRSSFTESKKGTRRNGRSSPVSIPSKIINFENEGKFHFSERWAGPAYSISPPPSSLPLPKFSLQPKRTVSLDLPTLAAEIDTHLIAKSAPASPAGGWRSPLASDLFDPPSPRNLFESSSPSDLFEHSLSSSLFDSADATNTLRRILNLDIATE